MWLASLRRFVLGNSRSPKAKQIRSQRRRIIPRLDYLEDRIVPSTITLPTVAAGDVTTLVGDITTANNPSNSYIINLTNSATNPYKTGINSTTAIGKIALPEITSGANITINGKGATINGQFLARLFEVSSGATLTLQNLTLTGGSVSGSTAKGGAVYNSGNLKMTSVVVGGNSAKAGSGFNGEGGGIYSNGGSLTLNNDVIGLKITRTFKVNDTKSPTTSASHQTTVGAANTAAGGLGGSGQGGGLFVAGGKVSVSKCDIGGNHAFGGANGNGQGGGIYASFASGGSLTLVHDVIGNKVVSHADFIFSKGIAGASSTAVGAVNTATAGRGGNGQGAGLYVNVGGGTLKVSNATIAGNHASGGINGSAQGGGIYANGGSVTLTNDLIGGKFSRMIGHNVSGSQTTKQTATGSFNGAFGATGGNGQGGGIYANSTTLSLTSTLVNGNEVSGGSGAAGSVGHFAGGAGGNAQGGGIYANATTVTLSGGSVDLNSASPGNGGAGAAGTALHLTGGAGGTSGIGQGGGVYVQGGSLAINGTSVSNNGIGTDKRGGDGGAGYSNATASTYGAGGAGGAGGVYEGGNVFASNASFVTVQGNAQINDATINGAFGGTGGAGGKGKTGGQGANAGFVAGGGLYIANGSVTLGSGVAVNDNSILPGWGGYGGNGGIGGNGGAGGNAEGGGLYALNASITLLNGTDTLTTPSITTPGISDNTANSLHGFGRGGNGGSGTAGAGGAGGNGGLAQGGGVFASGSNLAVTLGNNSQGVATVNDNSAAGGDGGSAGVGHGGTSGVGGAGGLGTGGGMTVIGDKLSLTNATIASNSAQGGSGGDGAVPTNATGAVSNFGNGGDAQGGGLFVANSSSVTVLNSTFANDSAEGSTGVNGVFAAKTGSAKYGLGGTALGGGMYADASTVNALNSTFAINLLFGGTNAGTSTSQLHVSGGGTAQGGGLYAANGTLSLINDTIAWNYLVTYTNRGAVQGQGGGIYNGPSNTLNLENTIVALDLMFTNSATGENNANGAYTDFAGTAASFNDHNLIGDGIDANLVPGGSQQLFAPALFSNHLGNATLSGQVPANYGGLTDTLPLAWNTNPPPSPPPAVMGDPAIGNGDPTAAGTIASYEGVSADSATDQRGLMRDIDSSIDIGATETQVVLNGNPSVTSVAANGPITYTLTVTNNESTSVNVTLTDVVAAFTSYNAGSASGTGWTSIVEPAATNLNTLTATATLNAGATATLSFTVTVASNVPGNTVIKDIASIAPTGNTAAGLRSVTMDSMVPGVSYSNITNEVEVHNNAVHPDPQMGEDYYRQKLMAGNDSGTTLQGPIAIVLTNLTPGVTLANATGTVPSGPFAGDPYIDIVTSVESWLSGWKNFLVVMLEFYDASDPNAANSAISYTPVFVQGI